MCTSGTVTWCQSDTLMKNKVHVFKWSSSSIHKTTAPCPIFTVLVSFMFFDETRQKSSTIFCHRSRKWYQTVLMTCITRMLLVQMKTYYSARRFAQLESTKYAICFIYKIGRIICSCMPVITMLNVKLNTWKNSSMFCSEKSVSKRRWNMSQISCRISNVQCVLMIDYCFICIVYG